MAWGVTPVLPSQSLQSLAALRPTPHFPFTGELDLAVGGAVESMGPEVVLGAVPLNITGYEYVPLVPAGVPRHPPRVVPTGRERRAVG